MAPTLKRSRRRALVLSPSFLHSVKSKVYASRALPASSRRVPDTDRSSSTSRRSRRAPPGQTLPARPRSLTHHPVLTLPDEVLAEIFLAAAATDPAAPLALAAVCAHWRHLAVFSTPRLWRHIAVDHRDAMWRERIRRAQRCPLDIEFATLDARGVHTVMPFIRRWRSLRIEQSPRAYAPLLWNALLGGCCGVSPDVEAPRLEEMSLCFPRNDDSKEFALFNGVAPRLRKLKVQGIRLTWTPTLYERLTHLDLTFHGFTSGDAAIAEILDVFRISSLLVELRLCIPSHQQDALAAEYPHNVLDGVILRHLRDLTLHVSGPDVPAELIHLMSSISMPHLSSLHLTDLDHATHPFRSLPALGHALRHVSTLSVLHVEERWFAPRFVLALLHSSPKSLQHLVVDGPPLSEQFLQEMSALRHGRRIRPAALDAVVSRLKSEQHVR